MSTSVFVDPESSTQADGAQSSRVLVPLPKDPYEAIRQTYLDGTDTESEPFEDPIDTDTPELPITVAPPISLSKSTLPVLVPILCRTAHMAVRVPPAMSSGLSASIAEVAAMSESAFHKRFRSSYESSPSVSPPDLPSRKRYRGMFELVEDSEEDEEIDKSLDSDSVGKDAEDEGSTAEDEDPAAGNEGLAAGVEGPGMDDESYGLDYESHGKDDEGRGLSDDGHIVESDGLGLEEEEEAIPGAGSSSRDAWGLIHDHAVRLEELSPALFERYDMDIGELFTRSGAVRDEIFSQRYQFRSLEYEHERVAVTFGAIWRPVFALESWLVEERRARLELAEVIDSMRRGQEPRGGDIIGGNRPWTVTGSIRKSYDDQLET
ncbi:hypothetical protein Tco_0041165, partial [Tanacetum coccineum]